MTMSSNARQRCFLVILTLFVVGVVIYLNLYSSIKSNPNDQVLQVKVGEDVKYGSIPFGISTKDDHNDQVQGEIERRLAEANMNWQKGVEERENLERRNHFKYNHPWSFHRGISIWDLFSPNFDCPYTVERIGGPGDGGKWVCGLKKIAKKKGKCVVYSYGVKDDTDFEEEIVRRTNCSIYLFDHTIRTYKIDLPKLYPGRVFIEKVGIAASDYTKNLGTIRSTMKKYDHYFIDIIKIDVEGSEFDFFDNIQKDFPDGIPFGQLQLEIHLCMNLRDLNEN